jgi:hypothetical protein
VIDNKLPDDKFSDILSEFWRSDRVTVLISIVIVGIHLISHFILDEYTTLPDTIQYYHLLDFATAFIFGYAGQRVIYSILGKAEKKLMEKTDKIIG